MKASVLPKYLFGSHDAIRTIAASRASIWIGAIFVLSAGLAREYDGEDLLHEPWHALRPLGASLVTGTVLFFIVHAAASLRSAKGKGLPPTSASAYRSFLALFWMTAPMAWLYAIPYERFMSPVDAITANLWTLALVAAWRVILMIRVVNVLYGIGVVPAFFLVMLFADAVVFAVVTLVPTPVIDLMGGIRQSDRDALIASMTLLLTLTSVLTAPVWILGALISTAVLKPKWPDLSKVAAPDRSRGMLVVALVSLIVFAPLLILAQPEQINRREAERLLTSGRVAEALGAMSSKTPEDYPPHWNPPPRTGYAERVPPLDDVRRAMVAKWPADWVASLYVSKINNGLHAQLFPHGPSSSWDQSIGWIDERGEGYPVDEQSASTAAFLIEHDASLSDDDRQALRRLIDLAAPTDPRSPL